MTHLIVFCHLRWDFVYQRPQHLLSRLAEHYPVVFIEEPVRAEPGAPARLEVRQSAPGVTVLRARTDIEAPGFHDHQTPVLRPLIAAYLNERGIDDYVVWHYTPMALPLANGLRPRAVVFDCMDELSAFKDAPTQLRQRELELLKRADLVFAGGPSLYKAKRAQHPRVLCLPSAVDAKHYAAPAAGAGAELRAEAAAAQARIGSPRLGFFGVIDERLDLDLLARVAQAQPAWQFVMVGPVVKIDAARLPRHANIHWLGQQTYALLPHLVASWDVCLLPFALNDATRYISPTKTLEYMAAGKPVVSTPIRDVLDLYGDIVGIAGDAPAFVAACRHALAESDLERTRRTGAMRARVKLNSWDVTVQQMARAIDGVLSAQAALPGAPAPSVGLMQAAPRGAWPQEGWSLNTG